MTTRTTTYCRICEAACGLEAEVVNGRIVNLRPDKTHPRSKGFACTKGLNAHRITHDPDRIVYPMKRAETRWQRISWDQAIEEIAQRLGRVRNRFSPHAVALFYGNPSAHSYSHRLFGAAFQKGLGTRNVFGAASIDNAADFVASHLLYGSAILQGRET